MKGRFGRERSRIGEISVGREGTKGEEKAVWFPMQSQYAVSSILAVQQLGTRERDPTAIQTKWEGEIYLLNSTTAKLWLF